MLKRADKRELSERCRDYQKTHEYWAMQLRLDLADLLTDHLRETGITQRELAAACGMKESFLSRIIHSDSNCTFDVAARVLHSIGVKPQLVDRDKHADKGVVSTAACQNQYIKGTVHVGESKLGRTLITVSETGPADVDAADAHGRLDRFADISWAAGPVGGHGPVYVDCGDEDFIDASFCNTPGPASRGLSRSG